MKRILLSLLVPLCLSLCLSAYAADDLMSRANKLFKPIPTKAPSLKGNPATAAKLELGAKLFFDPRLSSSQLISCNTCHNVGLAGADLQETSTGHGWQKGPRNSPTVFNAVFDAAQFWDGRAKDLQTQAKGPVQAAVEMNSNPELVVKTLKSIPGYAPLFKAAFPGATDPITFDNMAKAIEVFEATLLTPNSPFDRFLKGDAAALNAKEKRGLRIFMDKGCAPCHAGTNVGGADYYPFGVRETPTTEIRPAGDTGRFMVTNTESDRYVFKAPSLRNVAVTQPYFHSGKVWKLQEAVTVMGSAQLGVKLKEGEVADTVAFLKTLTGRQPRLSYPLLPAGSDETPHPQLK
ncbi:cytochrome-c peroxidase [Geomonas propionica]|uniref:Cytochrome-c peroxidase n=1 Tax=Geomonas propionica TaxID=2798582 RepID=A0ABS0YL63_9BACT|nr:cytochrome-c peroxidase [Geomonas propionica]MBJ6798687.1 cytochrome-c peroxidase [Geomonas propionica]